MGRSISGPTSASPSRTAVLKLGIVIGDSSRVCRRDLRLPLLVCSGSSGARAVGVCKSGVVLSSSLKPGLSPGKDCRILLAGLFFG